MRADFSGYATKAGLKCSDGKTIMPDAFKHQDNVTVPLVWQHGHSDAGNVLGHAILENREDGVYAYGFFNDTAQGKNARTLVEHGDIDSLSIYANQLIEKTKQVFHGIIREVSLVLAGANPGAKIDYVAISHSDGDVEVLEDEAIIYSGITIEHDGLDEDETSDEELSHEDGKTVKDVYDALTDEQKNVVHYMIGVALEEATSAEHSDNDESSLTHQEGTEMTRNVFEQNGVNDTTTGVTLSHDAIKEIAKNAVEFGSLKAAVEGYALSHGIEDIELLFPDAKNVTTTPEFDKRRTEWVSRVLNGTKHLPYSRIKSMSADLTQDEARAKGYIKGNLKKEEFFGLKSRKTTPTTIYKKQKLDRDDMIDITDFDVVVWLKAEMRLMLEEELARAILIGDGREIDDDDKIRDPQAASDGAGIRSIANDHELYAPKVYLNLDDANSDYNEVVDAVIAARSMYKGSGNPTFYTSTEVVTKMLMIRDGLKRRMYRTVAELAAELRVADIVEVEVFENEPDLVGIMVNLADYAVGTDKGGETNFFDDFDIDYNQYKYLYEARPSGALTKIRSALVFKKTLGTNVLATPAKPAFNKDTDTLTIPTTTGVDYKIDGVTTTGSVVITEETLVQAVPKTGYYFATSDDDSWIFDPNS